MMSDGMICVNSKVDGKQPYIEDRIYYGGGVFTGHYSEFRKLWMLDTV